MAATSMDVREMAETVIPSGEINRLYPRLVISYKIHFADTRVELRLPPPGQRSRFLTRLNDAGLALLAISFFSLVSPAIGFLLLFLRIDLALA